MTASLLTHLVERVLAPRPILRPRRPSPFEAQRAARPSAANEPVLRPQAGRSGGPTAPDSSAPAPRPKRKPGRREAAPLSAAPPPTALPGAAAAFAPVRNPESPQPVPPVPANRAPEATRNARGPAAGIDAAAPMFPVRSAQAPSDAPKGAMVTDARLSAPPGPARELRFPKRSSGPGGAAIPHAAPERLPVAPALDRGPRERVSADGGPRQEPRGRSPAAPELLGPATRPAPAFDQGGPSERVSADAGPRHEPRGRSSAAPERVGPPALPARALAQGGPSEPANDGARQPPRDRSAPTPAVRAPLTGQRAAVERSPAPGAPALAPAPPIVPEPAAGALVLEHAAAQPARHALPGPTAAPDVHITIGRVEIRAAPASAPARPPPPRRSAAVPSLADYLARRDEGRR